MQYRLWVLDDVVQSGIDGKCHIGVKLFCLVISREGENHTVATPLIIVVAVLPLKAHVELPYWSWTSAIAKSRVVRRVHEAICLDLWTQCRGRWDCRIIRLIWDGLIDEID